MPASRLALRSLVLSCPPALGLPGGDPTPLCSFLPCSGGALFLIFGGHSLYTGVPE